MSRKIIYTGFVLVGILLSGCGNVQLKPIKQMTFKDSPLNNDDCRNIMSKTVQDLCKKPVCKIGKFNIMVFQNNNECTLGNSCGGNIAMLGHNSLKYPQSCVRDMENVRSKFKSTFKLHFNEHIEKKNIKKEEEKKIKTEIVNAIVKKYQLLGNTKKASKDFKRCIDLTNKDLIKKTGV